MSTARLNAVARMLVPLALAGAVAACEGTEGPAGPAGDACTIAKDAQGTTTITCGKTTVSVNDGKAGTDGKAGVDGKDGSSGTSCTVKDNGDGSKTINCTDGTSATVSDGKAGTAGKDGKTCSLKDNGDGTKTITCADISVTVKDGVQGPAGADGKSCTIKDNGNGTKTISCADGTTVNVSDGKNGTNGPTGPTGPAGATGGNVAVTDFHGGAHLLASGEYALATNPKYYVDMKVTSATADAAGTVTVNFTVTNAATKAAVTSLPLATDATTTVTAVVAKLQPPANGESFTKWVPYFYNKATVTQTSKFGPWPGKDGDFAWQGNRVNQGTLTHNGNGAYTLVLKYKLGVPNNTGGPAISYTAADRKLTHRISLMTGGHSGPTGDANFDFVPDGTAMSVTRDIVKTETCEKCHNKDEFHGHGGDRLTVENCVTCHDATTIDPQGKETVDFKVMIHKIHAGEGLASIAGADGIVFDNPATTANETADNGSYAIWGNGNTKHTWWKVGFPAVESNCTACHTGSAKNADNWKNVPSRAACGSCHDTVNFVDGTNHKAGKQLDDSKCAVCHSPESVIEYHDWTVKDPRNIPEFDVKLAVSAPANGKFFVKGEAPEVTVQLTDKVTGKLIDHNSVVEDTAVAPATIAAEGCWTAAANAPIPSPMPSKCVDRDGKFTGASLFVHGPRANRVPVLTSAARVKIASATTGPWDVSAAGFLLAGKLDGGMAVQYQDITGGDKVKSAVFSVDLSKGTYVDKTKATADEIAAYMNKDAVFTARAIAYVEGGKLVLRSRNLGNYASIQLTAGKGAEMLYANDLTAKGPGSFTASNNISKRASAANDDPKVTRSLDKITYKLDAVDDLVAGTYVASVEIADGGRIDGNNYRTPSVGKITFQVGQETEEPLVADNCNSCHQNAEGKGFVLDFSRHNKIFDNAALDTCGACHDYQPQAPTGDFAGSKPMSRRVHAIHFGSSLHYPLQTVWYSNGDPIAGRNWDITLPQDVRNCETCHSAKTSGTWKTNANRLACWGCHDSDAAQAHIKLNVYDPTPADPYSGDEEEACKSCH